MEALIVVLFLLGLGFLVLSVAFYVLLWRTLVMHRQAMHALHQELAQRRVRRGPVVPNLGHIPPQEGRE